MGSKQLGKLSMDWNFWNHEPNYSILPAVSDICHNNKHSNSHNRCNETPKTEKTHLCFPFFCHHLNSRKVVTRNTSNRSQCEPVNHLEYSDMNVQFLLLLIKYKVIVITADETLRSWRNKNQNKTSKLYVGQESPCVYCTAMLHCGTFYKPL